MIARAPGVARAPRGRPASRRAAGALALALLSLAGCRAAPSGAPAVREVAIRGMQFDPPVVRAAAGDTVRWTNHDLVPHTITARSGGFDSGSVAPDASWTLVVRAAGEQPYACTFHPTMRGTIVVQARGTRSSGS